MPENEDAIAKLRALIEQTCSSLNQDMSMHPAQTRHALISQYYDLLGTYTERLSQFIDRSAAIEFVLTTL